MVTELGSVAIASRRVGATPLENPGFWEGKGSWCRLLLSLGEAENLNGWFMIKPLWVEDSKMATVAERRIPSRGIEDQGAKKN